MGMIITPTNSDKEYADIKGNLAENFCQLHWQAMKVYRLDESTIAIAGWLQTAFGLEAYPRDKTIKYPELAVLKLHKGQYQVNGKDAGGNWIKVDRQPSRIEKAFAAEVLDNWTEWEGRIFEGSIGFNDGLVPESVTPLGKNNNVWSFNINLHGSVVEWMQPESKDKFGGFNKYPAKRTPVELYEDVKSILEKELHSDRPAVTIIRELKAKYGESETCEILNTVLLGVLPK